jgi:hypothetical protein
MKTVAHTPIADSDSVGRLHLLLSSGSNDVRLACMYIVVICNTKEWEARGFKSLIDLITAPFYKGGLASEIGLVWAIAATNHMGSRDVFLKHMPPDWADSLLADVKAAKAKVMIDAIKPAMTKSQSGKLGGKARWSKPGHTTVCTTSQTKMLNMLKHRVTNPEHPKHEQAKKLLGEVERGEIKPGTICHRLADQQRVLMTHGKTVVRSLTPATRAEFLDWLVAQGAVLSFTPNPDFAGFTDGRAKKATP